MQLCLGTAAVRVKCIGSSAPSAGWFGTKYTASTRVYAVPSPGYKDHGVTVWTGSVGASLLVELYDISIKPVEF